MISRDITQCHPDLQAIWQKHKGMIEYTIPGITAGLSCTSREWIDQRALHAQGRESVEMVNHLRHGCGMAPITEEENRRTVTDTLESKHIIRNGIRDLSDAYDIFLMRGGKITWDEKLFIQAAGVGRSLGLVCGADFLDKNGKPKPDYPHFERKVL